MTNPGGSDLAPNVDPGRSHLIGYRGWPPPVNITEHLEVFLGFVRTELRGTSLLEVGCGDGAIGRLLAESRAGVDVISTDRERHPQWGMVGPPNQQLLEASVYELPFGPNSIDTVVMKDVLHHLPDPATGVAELVRVARQRVLLIEANRYNPVSYIRMVRIAGHDHFSRRKLERVIGDRRFEVRTVEAHVWPEAVAGLGRVHDRIFESVPLLARLRNYNLAVISTAE